MFIHRSINSALSATVLAFLFLGWNSNATPPTIPVVVPDDSIVPHVTPAFLPLPILHPHANTFHLKLVRLGFEPRVFVEELPPAFKGFAADNIRGLLHANQHHRNLLYLTSSEDGPLYAVNIPPEQAGRFLGGRREADTARFGLITVRRGGGRIDLNGFVRVEAVGDRNALQWAITRANGMLKTGAPFSHDLYHLLDGIRHGF